MNHQSFQPDDPRHDRLEELLCDKAVQGLSAAEEAELRLLRADLGVGEDDSIEQAAASAMLAMTDPAATESLPAELRSKLDAKAAAWCRGESAAALSSHELSIGSIEFKRPAPVAVPAATMPEGTLRFRDRLYLQAQAASRAASRVASGVTGRVAGGAAGWAAAAAALTLAALVSTRQSADPGSAASSASSSLAWLARADAAASAEVVRAVAMNSSVARYDELISSGRPLVAVAAAPPTIDPDAAEVAAEFVWEPSAQTGFLRVSGLAATADKDRTYQAWIFDQGREEPYPVDAGTFDIPHDGGTWIIPVSARLPVLQPKAFAVTVERIGGTVVSAPERVLLVGQVANQSATEFVGPPSDAAFDRRSHTPHAAPIGPPAPEASEPSEEPASSRAESSTD